MTFRCSSRRCRRGKGSDEGRGPRARGEEVARWGGERVASDGRAAVNKRNQQRGVPDPFLCARKNLLPLSSGSELWGMKKTRLGIDDQGSCLGVNWEGGIRRPPLWAVARESDALGAVPLTIPSSGRAAANLRPGQPATRHSAGAEFPRLRSALGVGHWAVGVAGQSNSMIPLGPLPKRRCSRSARPEDDPSSLRRAFG